jgi:hypothetical protein
VIDNKAYAATGRSHLRVDAAMQHLFANCEEPRWRDGLTR